MNLSLNISYTDWELILYAENFLDFLKIEIPKNYSNYL